MPIILIERVLSVNSEDPANPAENLLKPDNNKKWKCKTGEKQATIILQLKQNVVIEAIDIGNEHSAFVEVLVGRSSSPNEDYKVLLVASSLMTLREAKDGTNVNGVRFFKKADLTKPTCDAKWDRVKIVCTQPFNKHVSYGLSFVTLHAAGDSVGTGDTSVNLGRFVIKDDKEESPAVGSWFAKRKDPPAPVPLGAAAALRDASSPANFGRAPNKKPTPRKPKVNTPKNGVLKPDKVESKNQTPKRDPAKVAKPLQQLQMALRDDEDSPADDTDADSTYSPTKDSTSVLSDDEVIPVDSEDERPTKKPKRTKKDDSKIATKDKKKLNGQTSNLKVNDSGGKNTKLPKETRPFNRLFDGVTIVISGYQNPLRGELRAKASAMGAKYKADWDNSCTHLICAFVNTPKFNQVRGRGKIVKKEWVENCHNQRKRLPWRRFALDRDDNGTSSEGEVWEEGSVPTTSGANTIASSANRRLDQSGSGSDTEDEIERVRARQALMKVTKPADKPAAKPVDPFSADTDVESDSESQTANLPLPPLPTFFADITFHTASDINEDERRKLHRYIVGYKGSVVDEMEGSVEYVITRSPDIAAEVGEEFGVSCVSPEWVWECSDAGRFVPVNQFIL